MQIALVVQTGHHIVELFKKRKISLPPVKVTTRTIVPFGGKSEGAISLLKDIFPLYLLLYVGTAYSLSTQKLDANHSTLLGNLHAEIVQKVNSGLDQTSKQILN
jgi:hypothetical protein